MRRLRAPDPAKAASPRRSAGIRRIVVRPDQVSQADPRPWLETSLLQIVLRWIIFSGAVVGAGLLALLAWIVLVS